MVTCAFVLATNKATIRFWFQLESVAQSITHFLWSQIKNHHRAVTVSEPACTISQGQILQQHEVSHKTLLYVSSQINFVFPPHIYQHVVKTVILQTIAHVQRHQRITSISAYFDYMRVADTIDSQKLEETSLTNYHKCYMGQRKCRECNRKYFAFTQVKSSAAYIRVTTFVTHYSLQKNNLSYAANHIVSCQHICVFCVLIGFDARGLKLWIRKSPKPCWWSKSVSSYSRNPI
jgi:hypothetical protein